MDVYKLGLKSNHRELILSMSAVAEAITYMHRRTGIGIEGTPELLKLTYITIGTDFFLCSQIRIGGRQNAVQQDATLGGLVFNLDKIQI